MRSPSALRILTAFSSSRSRERVAWVTLSPSSARSLANWLWERTGCRLRMSTIRRWRAVRVCGTAWALSFSCAWLIVVVPFCGSSFPLVGRASGLPRGVEDAGQGPQEGVRLLVGEHQRRHQPYDVGGGRVDQQAGVLGRLLDGGCERLGEHDTQQQARTTDVADERVAEPLDSGAQPLADPFHLVEEAVGGDGGEDGEPG